jgi:hypothetical protein
LEFHFFKEKRMVDFRKKLLGLGLLVSAFTGVSYGQILCPLSAAPGSYQIQPGLAANLLRVEGLTEEVADLNIYCGAGSTLATGTLTVSLNAQVTSKGVGGATDALLSIVTNNDTFGGPAAPPVDTATPTLYYGTITAGSTTVVFSNVNFPAGSFTMRIQNIRVNATQIPVTPGANQVNESVLVTNAGVGIFAPASQLVGLVYQGFKAASVSGVANWLMCLASPQGGVPTITISELFGGAFKSTWPQGQTSASTNKCGTTQLTCTSTNGENGTGNASTLAALPFPVVPAAGTGLATHGTRFQIAFANIPTGVALTVPVTPSVCVTNCAGAVATQNFLTMQLVSSATGAYSALASGVLTTSATGTATAYYEVISTDNTVQLESIGITVTPTAAANFSVSPAGPITAVVTPAPQVALSTTSDVPDFSTATPTALNLTTWSLCQTTLLFPFVSTQGVETGIALSNTSLDPGKIGGGGVASTATPNQGACTLNFYGTNVSAPGTAVTVLGVAAPNPTGGATPYIQVAGTSNAFPIGSSGLVPSGFSGYLIAQCNYLYGHGFAYIAYQLGTGNGSTMGYTANILPTRPIGSGATIASETLLQ